MRAAIIAAVLRHPQNIQVTRVKLGEQKTGRVSKLEVALPAVLRPDLTFAQPVSEVKHYRSKLGTIWQPILKFTGVCLFQIFQILKLPLTAGPRGTPTRGASETELNMQNTDLDKI